MSIKAITIELLTHRHYPYKFVLTHKITLNCCSTKYDEDMAGTTT